MNDHDHTADDTPAWKLTIDAADAARLGSADALGKTSEGSVMPWRSALPTATLEVTALSRDSAPIVQSWLARYYPREHLVTLTTLTGETLANIHLGDLAEQDIEPGCSLLVPPLSETENVRTFSGLMELTRRLRAPDGCAWDREQSHSSLKKHLLEEAYEVIHAMDSEDPEAMAEELGDLLFQIAIHSQVAAEMGEFTIEDVIQRIMVKLIGRHPHVFGDLDLQSSQEVLDHWETFKQREKPKRMSIFESIPRELPALPQSSLMQKRAAGVGFEWPSLHDVLGKVEEEIDELRHEIDSASAREELREEFGDLLFALVSVGRHLHLDPEEALRLANRKFAARFQYVESRVTSSGKQLRDLSASELDEYWEEAKALGTVRR
jgi:tetrapyrrole methylase family protein / MazG family protein